MSTENDFWQKHANLGWDTAQRYASRFGTLDGLLEMLTEGEVTLDYATATYRVRKEQWNHEDEERQAQHGE